MEKGKNETTTTTRLGEKWEEDNVLARDYTLHCLRGDIISLYDDYKIAKEIHDALEEK
jgi:hypothetical protein